MEVHVVELAPDDALTIKLTGYSGILEMSYDQVKEAFLTAELRKLQERYAQNRGLSAAMQAPQRW